MAKEKLELKNPAAEGDNPELQNLLGDEKPAETKQAQKAPEAPEAEKPAETKDNKPQVPEAPKTPKKAKNGAVVFYTRKGDPFDSKTGKPRPTVKHCVSRAEWQRIKNSVGRLGYTIVKVEE